MEKTYNTPVRIPKLGRELAAAAISVGFLGGPPADANGISAWVTVVASGDEAPVDTVIAAHDPNTPDAAEVQDAANQANTEDFYASYTAMIADLEAIEQRLTDSKAIVDASIAEGQASPPSTVNQVWQKARTALQELSEAEQQAIRLTRVTRRTVKAARAVLDS